MTGDIDLTNIYRKSAVTYSAFVSEARGIRTPDNLIKSQVLYRLS